MKPYDIIKRPLITEKTTSLQAQKNVYAFEVYRLASKSQIKSAVEKVFPGVKVVEVRTQIRSGKTRRVGARVTKRGDWKRALVSLREGDKIEGLTVA